MIGEKIELSEKITEIEWINNLKYQIIKEIRLQLEKNKTIHNVKVEINKLTGLKKKLFTKVFSDIIELKKGYIDNDKLAKIKLQNYGIYRGMLYKSFKRIQAI